MTELRDAFVVGCITQQQKNAIEDFCWKNRITKSSLVCGLITDFLETVEVNA